MQNCTLRDNVLFGMEYAEAKYEAIIDACALRSDINILPGGDQGQSTQTRLGPSLCKKQLTV